MAERDAGACGRIADVAFYKGRQLAVLATSGDASCTTEAQLLLLPTEDLPMTACSPADQHGTPDLLQVMGSPSGNACRRACGPAHEPCCMHCLQRCREGGASQAMDWEGARRRALCYSQAHAPLAVSGPRGVACVLVGLQRILLLDLVSFAPSTCPAIALFARGRLFTTLYCVSGGPGGRGR